MPLKKAGPLSKNARGRARETVDLLIVNANELVTVAGDNAKPRTGKQMRELGIIKDGCLAVKEGRVVAVGKTSEVTKVYRGEEVVSAHGKTVMPGFVDAHTHLVFAGSREEEFEMRVEGASYLEILSAGGGILKTVRETRDRKSVVEGKSVDLGGRRI